MKYSVEELADLLEQNQPEGSALVDKKKIKENAANPFFAGEVQKLKAVAEDAAAHPSVVLPFSEYQIFDTEGSRDPYDPNYLKRRMRLNALVFMELISDDGTYLKAIEDEIWVWLNEYIWAIPASMQGDSLKPSGSNGVPQEKYLDLCSTEMAYTLAEIDALIGEKLAPLIRYRMKQEVFRRVLDSYMGPVRFGWESCDNNWAAVCGGSVGAAAIYYVEDSKELAKYLVRVLDTMDCFLSGYDSDGACVEGVSYWSYGFSYYIFFSELLKQRTNGAVDLLAEEKVHQMALFLQRCRIEKNQVINFSDCAGYFTYRVGMLHKLRERYPDVLIPPAEYTMRFHDDHCYRWPGFIRDYMWFDSSFMDKFEDKLENGHFFQESQVYLSRKNGAFFAVAGGHNGYSHNHNDLGHFIYHAQGESVLIDIGQGIYTKEYFSEGRYNIINNSARGHSVPQINGCLQMEGTEHCVRVMDVQNGDTDIVRMDLSKAYDCPALDGLIRTFVFRPDGSLELTDGFTLKQQAAILEQFVVDVTEEPEIADGQVILVKNEAKLTLKFDGKLQFKGIEKIPGSVMARNQSDGLRIIQFISENLTQSVDFRFHISF